jgi:hypothetical protein
LLANAALTPGGGGFAPSSGGSPSSGSPNNPSGGSPNSGAPNSSSAPTCTCSQPKLVPINLPTKKDTPTKKRSTDSTPHGPKPPTDEDIARSGRPAGGQQGPSGAEVMEGLAIGAGVGAGMAGGMRGGGGGMHSPPPSMGTGGYGRPSGPMMGTNGTAFYGAGFEGNGTATTDTMVTGGMQGVAIELPAAK